MKRVLVIKIIFIFSIVISPSIVFAVGGCPQSADRLQDFAGCVVQTRGGAVLGSSSGYGAHLDDDHRELMGAMSANSGVPPQVMPVSGPIINAPFMPMYYPIYPIYPVKRGSVWLYTSYGVNPYINMLYSAPLY